MNSELKSLSLLSLVTVILIILFEILARKEIITKSISRKLLHITSGFIVVLTPILIDTFYLVLMIGIIFSIVNYYLIQKKVLKQINDEHTENLGIFYYPFSYVITVILFWDVNKFIISLSYLIFSIGDALAALSGTMSKTKHFTKITSEPKTFNGSIVFILVSFLLVIIVKLTIWHKFGFIEYEIMPFIFIALIYSILGGITEALSTKGTDNLSLPIVLSTASMIFFVKGVDLNQFLIASILAVSISSISYQLKYLDLGGSLLTFLLALFIFGLGEWKWTIPILTFFILSSFLSKINDKVTNRKLNEIIEKGSKRDYKQVLANGGVPLLICIFNALIPFENDWYLIYILAVSISTADTWSTEIGTLFAKNVYMIATFKKVEAGISGGISLIGTLGGFAGSLIILVSSLFFIELTISQSFMILFFSLLGNFTDSLIGATLQSLYKCEFCGKITEKRNHCNRQTTFIRGIKFIDNDIVNLSSVLFISILYFIFLIL